MSFAKTIGNPMILLGVTMDNATNVASELHGVYHWRHVTAAGLEIATKDPEVDLAVLFLFSMFHDCMRINDFTDPQHGLRAAGFVVRLYEAENFFKLSPTQRQLLNDAILYHTQVKDTEDPTIGACWDADRLTLPRVGIQTDPEFLHHDYSKRAETRLVWADTIHNTPPTFTHLWVRYCQLDESR